MGYENCTIRRFIKEMFVKEPSQEMYDIYNEYINTSELYNQEQFEKTALVYFLNSRINTIAIAIRLQRDFIRKYNEPFVQELDFFKKFGHRLSWKDDVEIFLMDLDKIELKEKKYNAQLEKAMKELVEMKSKNKKEVVDDDFSRRIFLNTIISLGKEGYRINKDEDTMEELALMVKQFSDSTKTE